MKITEIEPIPLRLPFAQPFKISQGARETLETIIGFNGRFRDFRVRLLAKESLKTSTAKHGSRSKGSNGRKRRSR